MANWRLLLILLCGFILIPIKSSKAKVSFIDVGQGDGIYIDAGEDITIDCGSSSSKHIGEYTIEPFLKSNKINKIEKVFITHADSDHTSGILYIAQNSDIKIKELYLPILAKDDSDYDELRNISDHVTYLRAGDIVPLKKGAITCLSPDMAYKPNTLNDQSLVLSYKYGDFSALLMGDASQEVEKYIVSNISRATVLKVGHHGSSTSTSAELLQASTPRLAILSYGQNNRYGHPHEETTELLSKYDIPSISTAKNGQISLYTDGTNLDIIRFIKE